MLLERSWWAGFNEIYLIRFGFKMWEILILKWFLRLKIQINSKNQVLEGKISWGHGNTWGNSTGHTSYIEFTKSIPFTLKQLDASQQSQTWSSTHSVMPWMLLDADLQAYYMVTLSIYFAQLCVRLNLVLFTHKTFAIVRRHQWHM